MRTNPGLSNRSTSSLEWHLCSAVHVEVCWSLFTYIRSSEQEEINNITLDFHFPESGHGKWPSDGLGEVIKKKLDRIIFSGKAINSADDAYLPPSHQGKSTQQQPNQWSIYVPRSQRPPKKVKGLKSLKGTQRFHMVETMMTWGSPLHWYQLCL